MLLVHLALLLLLVVSPCKSSTSSAELELQRSAFDLLKVDQSGGNPILNALKALPDVTVSQTVTRLIVSRGLSPVEKFDRIRVVIGDSLPLSTRFGDWGIYFDLVRLTLAPKVPKFRELITECEEHRHRCKLFGFLREVARSSRSPTFRGFAFSVDKSVKCSEENSLLLCLRRLEFPADGAAVRRENRSKVDPLEESASEWLLDGLFSVVDVRNLAHFEHVHTSQLALSSVSQRRNGIFPLLRDLDYTLRCPIVKRSARSVFPNLRNEIAQILMHLKHRPAAEKVERIADFLTEFASRRQPTAAEMYRIFDIAQDVLIESKWNGEQSCAFPESLFDERGLLRVAESEQRPLVRLLEDTWKSTKDVHRVSAILRGVRFEDAPIGLWGTLGSLMRMC